MDVVVLSCEKDLETLEYCLKGIKENVIPKPRRIIVISEKKLTENAQWFDEKQFPFSKSDVSKELLYDDPEKIVQHTVGGRVGWYYQQLLKLYAYKVIPGIADNVLIVDSDTVFLKPVQILNKYNTGLYATGKEKHQPYFIHMNKLIPGLKRVFPKYSGIVHHMLFQKEVLDDLFSTIENQHQCSAWKAMCHLVDSKSLYKSGFSEYEIYFNFLFSKKSNVQIKPLKWRNINSLSLLPECQKEKYDFVSCHDYLREKR